MVSADGALPETDGVPTIEQAELVLEEAVSEVSEHVDSSVVNVDAIRTRALGDAETMRSFFELSREDQAKAYARMSAERAALAETNVSLNAAIDGLQGRVGALEERVNTYLEDDVTGLPVRRYFILEAFPQLVDMLRRINTKPRRLTLVLIDFDNFRGANDELGYLGADKVLRSGADILQKKAFKRENTDKVARFGGDEYVAGIPTTPNADVERICRETLLEEMRKLRFGNGGDYEQTLSVAMVTIQVTKDVKADPLTLLKGLVQINTEKLKVLKGNGKDDVINGGTVTIEEVLEAATRIKDFKIDLKSEEAEPDAA
ncbi:GGDEF domain-containing protein [Patescibacteria group bacterium]